MTTACRICTGAVPTTRWGSIGFSLTLPRGGGMTEETEWTVASLECKEFSSLLRCPQESLHACR